jgi:hypothetical protein
MFLYIVTFRCCTKLLSVEPIEIYNDAVMGNQFSFYAFSPHEQFSKKDLSL